MASPGKRRRKRMNGGFGVMDTPETAPEQPKAEPAPEPAPEPTPEPEPKKSFFG